MDVVTKIDGVFSGLVSTLLMSLLEYEKSSADLGNGPTMSNFGHGREHDMTGLGVLAARLHLDTSHFAIFHRGNLCLTSGSESEFC